MITPILPVVIPTIPTTSVQPFTYKDGVTYLERLELLQRYINRVIIPYVNESYEELSTEVQNQVNALIEAFNSAVEAIINDTIEIQDPVIATLVNSATSETRIALNTLYLDQSEFDAAIEPLNDRVAELEKLTGGRVPVEYFGAVGDGITDDTASLTLAINSGKPVKFAAGKNYLTSRIVANADHIDVDATGATITMNNSTTSVIQRVIGFDETVPVSSITSASEKIAVDGSSVQPVYNIVLGISAPNNWVRGDILVIASDDGIPNVKTSGETSTERAGAFLTVISVNGTDLKVSGRIDDAMTTAIRIGKLKDINGFKWDGGTFDFTDAAFTGNGYVFFLANGFGASIKNVTFNRVKSAAFYLRGLLAWHIDNVTVFHGVNTISTAAYGYGVANFGSQQGVLSNSHFYDLRHGYTNGGSGTVVGSGVLGYNGRPSDNIIDNCVAESCTAAGFDSHTQGLRETFNACIVKNGELGIGLRGSHHYVSNCRVTNARIGVWVFDEEKGSPKGVTIDGLFAVNVDNVFEIRCNQNSAAPNYLVKETTPFIVRNVTSINHKGRLAVIRNAIVVASNIFATYGNVPTSNDFGTLVKNSEFYVNDLTVIATSKIATIACMVYEGHPSPSATIELNDIRVINSVASDYIVNGSATTQRCRITNARYDVAPTALTQFAYSTSYASIINYPV